MRKTLKVTLTNGRDAGKRFLVTEMSARAGYRWATRALFAVMNAGLEIPEDLKGAGFAGIAALVAVKDSGMVESFFKTLGKLEASQVEPLLDDLMLCVQVLPKPDDDRIVRALVEEDVEEITSFFVLQKEALVLHLGFFTDGE